MIQAIQGIEIPLIHTPFQGVEPRPISWSESEFQLMNIAVNHLVQENVVEVCQEEQYQFVSNIFHVPKQNGKIRIILDLSRFNDFVEKVHFKMEGIHTATNMIVPNVFMASIDLKDAYFTFPIAKSYRKFLKFRWNNKLWRFVGLPMGISCAPRIFTKLIAPIYAFLRKEGLQGFPYLDDSFVFGFSFAECQKSIDLLAWQLINLGFKVNVDKSELVPAQQVKFLGFIIDSVNMTVSLPEKKILNVLDICQNALQSDKLTIREVLHMVGTLNSYGVAVQYGDNHFKEIEHEQIKALKSSKGDFDVSMRISKLACQDFQWWEDNVRDSFKHIRIDNPVGSLFADASNLGWGACFLTRKAQSEWTETEQNLHINAKELLAIKYGLQILVADIESCTIHVVSDNTTAVAHINKMGGVRSTDCRQIAFDIWQWCENRDIWLYATHIPGVHNEIADSLSRNFSTTVEWELSNDIFQVIVRKFGSPSVDLFASRHNSKLPKYCAWFGDSYCWKTDAFSFKWVGEYFYIFPPFRLAGRCWRKIMVEQTKAILVVPDWPTQPWFASILMTAKEWVRFPKAKNNLTTPHCQTSDQFFANVPLIACRY